MSETSGARRTRLFIYGSCVSRDTYEAMDHEQYGLVSYVARQSLVSAMGSPCEALPELPAQLSRFQRRMIEGDIRSNLIARLEDALPDVDFVLWDLTDERLGVWVMPDGNYITRTPEMLGSDLRGALDSEAEVVAFGSAQHYELWTDAARRWTAILSTTGLLDRTIVIAPPWAATTETGSQVPSSFGLTARTANSLYEAYYQWLREAGYMVLTPPSGRTVGSATHRWGAAPFHYAPQTYDVLISAIGTACAVFRSFGPIRPGSPSDVPPPQRGCDAQPRRVDAVRMLASVGAELRVAGPLRMAEPGDAVVVEVTMQDESTPAGGASVVERPDMVLRLPPDSRLVSTKRDTDVVDAVTDAATALLVEHEGRIVLVSQDAGGLLLATAAKLRTSTTVLRVDTGDGDQPTRHCLAVAAGPGLATEAPTRDLLLVTDAPDSERKLDYLEQSLRSSLAPSPIHRELVVTTGRLSWVEARSVVSTALDVLRAGNSASTTARALVRRVPQHMDDRIARDFVDAPRFSADRRGDGTIHVHADATPAALPWLTFAFYLMRGTERLSIRWYDELPFYVLQDTQAATHIHCFARHQDGSSAFVRLPMPT